MSLTEIKNDYPSLGEERKVLAKKIKILENQIQVLNAKNLNRDIEVQSLIEELEKNKTNLVESEIEIILKLNQIDGLLEHLSKELSENTAEVVQSVSGLQTLHSAVSQTHSNIEVIEVVEIDEKPSEINLCTQDMHKELINLEGNVEENQIKMVLMEQIIFYIQEHVDKLNSNKDLDLNQNIIEQKQQEIIRFELEVIFKIF